MTASRSRWGRQRLGQHFLRNPGIARRIALAVPATPGSLVVEIGPGRGALSLPLLERGFRLLAVEADAHLAEMLTGRLASHAARIVGADALEADFGALLESEASAPVALAGNLPYESATPMIRKFVRHPEWFSSLTVMIQREVASRILSPPGGDAYGFLTLDIAAHASAAHLFDVGPKNFDPPPKVESTVLSLIPKRPADGTEGALLLASAGFAMRRKKLVNALESRFEKKRVEEALEKLEIPAGVRAEVLTLADFLSLSRELGDPGTADGGC